MSLNWSNVKSLAIPVGGVSRDVKRVSIGGVTVWEKNASPLPPGARWVEYLESTGTQYIWLSYLNASTLRIQTRVTSTTGNEQDVVGNQDNSSNRFVLGFYNGSCFAYSRAPSGNDGNASVGPLTLGTVCDIDCTYDTTINSKTLTVNGVSDTVSSCKNISNTNHNVTLFKNAHTGSQYYTGKIWYMKLYKDGVLWYDLIPVRVGNVGYLYDRVSGALFGNEGTGDFVVGPDAN